MMARAASSRPGALIRSLAAKYLLWRSPRSLRIDQITIRVAEADGESVIDSDVLLHQSEPRSRGPLVVGVPYPVICVEEEHGQASSQNAGTALQGTTILHPTKGRTWDGERLRWRLHWQSAPPRNPEILSFPDSLPRLYVQEQPAPLPRITLDAEAYMHCVGGVQATKRSGEDHFLQVVLSRSISSPREQGDWTTIVGAWGSELSLGERRRIDRLVGMILQHHGALFQVEPRIRIVVTSSRGGAPDHGAILALEEARYLGVRGGEPEYLMLGSRLARMWWGVGCQVWGPFGREVEAGIRAAAGMLWGDEVGSTAREWLLNEWKALVATDRRHGSRVATDKALDQREHARIALALYTAAQRGAPIVSTLAELSRNAWGQMIPEAVVREVLREAGAEL